MWDYCVQYQESSLDFISRLMELEGIAYYFSHEADKHTLVLTDAATQHQPFSGYEVIPYHQTPSGGSTDEEGISQWALEDSVTPGIYSLDDYDFRKPNAWLFQAQQNPASPKPGSIDVYDWPSTLWRQGMRSSTPESVRSAGRWSISRFRRRPRRRALRRPHLYPDQRAVLQ